MTADEVLSTMEYEDEESQDVCVIDAETRTISVPGRYATLGVESDEKGKRLRFVCPAVVGDNISLLDCSLRIIYRNGNRELAPPYLIDDAVQNGNNLEFSWLLSRKVTAYKGKVSFIFCAVKAEPETGLINNEWNTTLATATVLEGLEADQHDLEESREDIITQLLAAMHNANAAMRNANAAADNAGEAAENANKAAEKANQAAEVANSVPERVANLEKQTETLNNDLTKLETELKETLPNDGTLIDNVAEVVKTEVPYVKVAEQPDVVDSIAEMTDTSKAYVLSTDGYLYTYKEVENKNYNLLNVNNVEYLSRLQDGQEGIVSSTNYNVVTEWIPVTYGKYYALSALHSSHGRLVYSQVGETYNYNIKRMNGRKKDGTVIVWGTNIPLHNNNGVITIPSADIVEVQIHIASSNILGGVDISTADKFTAVEPMFVVGNTPDEAYNNAMNLEYVNGSIEVETVTAWYSTGMKYNQPESYEERVIELEKDVSALKEKATELEEHMLNPTSESPYYRDVNFGVLPFTYYQGLAESYENQGFAQNTTYADFIAKWKALVANHSGYVTETALGNASDGQTIYLYNFKPTRITNQQKDIPKIVIVAGQHGFEKSNIYGLYYFVDNLLNKWNQNPTLEYLRNHVELMIIPVLNTYGFDNLAYKNANAVNLNRNYDAYWILTEDATSTQYGGAEPFDQPETQIVRNLLNSNKDALLVIDFHTNGGGAITEYRNANWCAVCESTDGYYNRMKDSIAHHLSAITAHFNLDYELNQPDTMMGYMTDNDGTGLLRNWATDNNFIGVLIEGFNGFPNGTAFIGEVYRANEEIITNYLITALYYLSK